MRTSRKISTCLLLTALVLGQTVSILCAIGIVGFSRILSSISIPSGYIYVDLDIYTPSAMTVEIPYVIRNPSIYEITQLSIDLELRINYINESNHANLTSLVFQKSVTGLKCKAFKNLDEKIEGKFTDFLIAPLAIFHENVDITENVYYFLDFSFHGRYFLGLIKFSFSEFNINIFDL